jgi:hypothetical protein
VGYSVLDNRRNEDILKELTVDPFRKKLHSVNKNG